MFEEYEDNPQELVQQSIEEVDPSWDEYAEDDGRSVIEKRTYHVFCVSRKGDAFWAPTTRMRYRPQKSSAPGFSVQIEPDSNIREEDFLGGDIIIFVDERPLQVGRIETIKFNQNDEDYKIEARSYGSILENTDVQESVENYTVDDLMCHIIDEYTGTVHSHNSVTPDNVSLLEVGNNIYTVPSGTDSGSLIYNDLALNQEVTHFNLKVYTDPEVRVRITEAGVGGTKLYDEIFTGLDSSQYGDWTTVNLPSGIDSNIDMEIEVSGSGFLYDWNFLTDPDIVREVTPYEVNPVAENQPLAHVSDQGLYDQIAEVSASEADNYPTKNEGDKKIFGEIFWWDEDDPDAPLLRANQVSHLWVAGDFNYESAQAISLDDAAHGYAAGLQPGDYVGIDPVDQQSNNIKETWQDWGIMARLAPGFGPEDNGGSMPLTIIASFMDNNTTTIYEGDSNGFFDDMEDFMWYDLADATDFDSSNPPDYDGTSPGGDFSHTLSIYTDQDDDQNLLVDAVFFYKKSSNVLDTMTNELDEYNRLRGPKKYGRGYAILDPFVSDDNVTSAFVDTSMYIEDGYSIDPVGPSLRLDSSAPWQPNTPNTVSDQGASFRYPGVNVQVRIYLDSTGIIDDNTVTSPTHGWTSTAISELQVTTDTDDLEVIGSKDLEGNRLEELSNLADDTNFEYRFDGKVAQIFKAGSRDTDIKLLQESTESSYSIEDVYSEVKVIGDGVETNWVQADNAPDFIDRRRLLHEPDITTQQDAYRKAYSFISQNSTVRYSGRVETLPTPVPVGEVISGEHFTHGQDMIIEEASFGMNKTTIECGFVKKFRDQVLDYSKLSEGSRRRDTEP